MPTYRWVIDAQVIILAAANAECAVLQFLFINLEVFAIYDDFGHGCLPCGSS
jgi:hypothetical protein